MVIGIYAALHSGPVHNYVQNLVQQKASEALNTPVQLQNFVLHPLTGTVDLYGVVGAGCDLPPNANVQAAAGPLLQVEHMHLGVSRQSICCIGKLRPTDITVDSPVVYFYVERRREDEPADAAVEQQQSAARTCSTWRSGTWRSTTARSTYNDRKNTLDADLHDLTFQLQLTTSSNGGQYFGDGFLQQRSSASTDTYEPIPHELEAHFDAHRSGMTLSNVKLTSGQSQVLLNASLENYSNPQGACQVRGDARAEPDCAAMHEDPSLPAGMVLVNGTADYASVAGTAAAGNTHRCRDRSTAACCRCARQR